MFTTVWLLMELSGSVCPRGDCKTVTLPIGKFQTQDECEAELTRKMLAGWPGPFACMGGRALNARLVGMRSKELETPYRRASNTSVCVAQGRY